MTAYGSLARRPWWRSLTGMLTVLVVVAGLVPPAVTAAPLDRPVANGHFFTQTAGRDGELGFRVTNEGGARFWDEFQRLGGVQGVGYPISRRFTWKGFTVQAMQKGVLQWRPEVGRAWLTNVFDELHEAGKDEWLASVRSTPNPLPGSFDDGKDWNGIVRARQALLDGNAAIKATYDSVADPMTFFGLPTSRVTDQGNHVTIRLQRAVIQQWKVDVPWAKAGEVTVANGADVAKEAGLYPADALKPERTDGSTPAPPVSVAQRAADRLNHFRALSGLPPVRLDDALNKAASNHAAYYRLNYGDPSLSGMGLHQEIPGRPGFTGASWSDRARAAGYRGTVDENVGLVANPERLVDAFIDTVNHRWNMMHPSAVAIGYGIDTQRPIDVMNVGFERGADSTDKPAVYPGPNQTGVPAQSHIWETPDPAPGVPRPVGFPLTAVWPLRANVQWGQPSLVDAAGQALDIHVTTKAWLRGQAIVPRKPLRPGATYRATVRGTVDGRPYEYSWSFTTR